MEILLVRWRSHEDLVGKQLSTGQLNVKNGNLEKKKNFCSHHTFTCTANCIWMPNIFLVRDEILVVSLHQSCS